MSVISLLSKLKESGIRVRLMDDKLKLNAPKGKLTTELLNELKQQREQVVEFLRRTGKKDDYIPIEPVEKREYYQLSSAQKRLYLIQRMIPDSTAYNMPMNMLLAFDSHIDRNKKMLEFVLKRLLSRHDSFRTSFQMVDGHPVQRIHDEVDFEIEYYDQELSTVSNFVQPFDLSKAPLLRVGVIKTTAGKYTLFIDMHHIIIDGTSQKILTREFMNLYAGREPEPLRLQYKDYSEWQNSETRKAVVKKQEEYWLKVFAEEPPVLDLPLDYSRPLIQSFAGGNVGFGLEEYQVKRLQEMIEKFDVTAFMLFLCIFNLFLSKLSGQEDIVIGVPIAARRHVHLKNIIGMFVNTLPMRNCPSGEKTVAGFLKEVKQNAIKAYENQEYPFEDLVDKLEVNRDTGRNPVFDVVFNLVDHSEIETPGMKSQQSYFHRGGTSKFDLQLTVAEVGKGFYFDLNYCEKLFKPHTIERFIGYFKELVSRLVGNPEVRLGEIEIISPEEKRLILYDFNGTTADYPADKTIHQLFEEQAKRTPDGVSIVGSWQLAVCKGERIVEVVQLTYRELNRKADQLAHFLREKGVLADSIVGIMMHRSIEMIIGILGILKADGAYLPIDPGYPEERKHYMLADSGARVLLKKSEIRISKHETNSNDQNSNDQNKISTPIVLNFEHLDFEFVSDFEFRASDFKIGKAEPSNLVYVIYTSGTTGKSKGCMVEHRNVVRLMVNDRFQFDFNGDDVWTLFHSYCFDFSVWEMWGAFVYGGRLIIVPRMTARDPHRFLELVKKEQVTVLNQTPGAFYHFIEEALKQGINGLRIRYIIFGGEALAPARLGKWKENYPQTRLINMYGITETTVHVTFKEISHREIRLNQGNIGTSLPTLSVYIVDRYMKLQPPGVAGELCVGGDGVSRGYLNRPELTKEKFQIPNEKQKLLRGVQGGGFLEKSPPGRRRQYKSGDQARWLPDGELEYLGRIDHQVKIRGYRIEPGEIEYHIRMHPEVEDAVVVIVDKDTDINRPDSGRQNLCAYFVARQSRVEGKVEKSLAVPELKKYLAGKLPDYMIPAFFVQMEKIPFTTNGKVDRKMLRQPREMDFHQGSTYIAPKTDIQRIIAETWKEVLGRDKVGIRDNFFDLGGNSLDIVIVSNKLQEKLKRDIPVIQLFTYPTIGSLEEYLNRDEANEAVEDNESRADDFQLVDEGKSLMQQTLRKLDEED